MGTTCKFGKVGLIHTTKACVRPK